MINFTGSYTDQYQLTMSMVYFNKGKHKEKAVFDYFLRKCPFGGGYAIFAGLEDLLNILEELCFDQEDLDFLESHGFSGDFLEHLRNFTFSGDIYSSSEGDVVFPTRPILRVEASILEAQIIETLLLNILNFQTLVATKASRMRMVAGDRKLVDFGLRRAQGPGGYYASRAAVIGGFDATSNVRSGRDFTIPVSGTMAHSFIQSYDEEIEAFMDFARIRPDDCVLLIDTYDTLKSGLPNAIKVGKEMKKQGHQLKGIRLDSGDLAYLAKQCRKKLDQEGLTDVKIAASNQLDEYVIRSLNEQKAPIDLFGVGTSLIVGRPDAAIDGVYKLSFAYDKPRLKLSENIGKISLPHIKQVYRLKNDEDEWVGGDVITMKDERDIRNMFSPFVPGKHMQIHHFKKEPLLQKVMEKGKRTMPQMTVKDISRYSKQRISELPDEYKRFENPHVYKVGISEKLKAERDTLIKKYNTHES